MQRLQIQNLIESRPTLSEWVFHRSLVHLPDIYKLLKACVPKAREREYVQTSKQMMKELLLRPEDDFVRKTWSYLNDLFAAVVAESDEKQVKLVQPCFSFLSMALLWEDDPRLPELIDFWGKPFQTVIEKVYNQTPEACNRIDFRFVKLIRASSYQPLLRTPAFLREPVEKKERKKPDKTRKKETPY